MPHDVTKNEEALHDQTNLLAKAELLKVFGIMAVALCVCFIDQNGIGVLLPSIARDLNAQSTISWAGTSALIANTVFQVLYGRLSDLFGRKIVILSALVLLAFSDLICGLAPNATVLYVFRGLAGVANGGITSLSMMIVSDVVTLQQRGKYQGILGTMVGLGNAIGPLIAAGFDQHTTWRGLFYLLAPLVLVAAVASWKWLPSNMPKLEFRKTLVKVDFLGLVFGTAAIILVLIPVSEGGHGVAWDSAEVVAMLTVGAVCAVAFVVVEWRFAKLPMMPCTFPYPSLPIPFPFHLPASPPTTHPTPPLTPSPTVSMFQKPSVTAMLLQNLLFGACYYTYLYYLPLYYQNVHSLSTLTSALLLLPLVVAQSLLSILSGQYISRLNRYAEVIWAGFAIWTLGSGLLVQAGRDTSLVSVAVWLALVGAGTGCVFQPTLVALQAHCAKSQRAVVTSNRNFLRSLGGAVGLAVSAALLGNVLQGSLPPELQYVAKSTFATPDLSAFSPEQREVVKEAYAEASRAVFVFCTPLMGVCLALCAVIRDRGLQRKEERVVETEVVEEVGRGEGADVEKSGAVDVVAGTDVVEEKGVAMARSGRQIDEDGGEEEGLSRRPSVMSQNSEKSEKSEECRQG